MISGGMDLSSNMLGMNAEYISPMIIKKSFLILLLLGDSKLGVPAIMIGKILFRFGACSKFMNCH